MRSAVGSIQTVLGPIKPSALGPTLMHEHIFADVTWAQESAVSARVASLADQPVRSANLWWVRRQPLSSSDNMRLTGPALAVEELRHYAAVGGSGLVELTVRGISPRPDLLAKVARMVRVHIVAGTGYYMHRTRPAWWGTATVEEVALTLCRDITEGFTDAPAVRSGIIGELAIEGPDSSGVKRIEDLGDSDLKLLRAACFAQAVTGASISIHLPHSVRGGSSPPELAAGVVDLLDQAGADIGRVILGHVDRSREWTVEQLIALVRRGAVIQFDEWGLEGYVDNSDHVNPLDDERIAWTIELASAGCLDKLVWSHDVYLKYMLRKHGGTGYAHISEFVVPRLLRRGLTEQDVATVMTDNPRRLLTLAPPTRSFAELAETVGR